MLTFILRFLHIDFPEHWTIKQPCFYAAAYNDSVSIHFQPMMEKYAKDLVTIDCLVIGYSQFNSEFETWLREKLKYKRQLPALLES